MDENKIFDKYENKYTYMCIHPLPTSICIIYVSMILIFNIYVGVSET